MIRRMSLVTDRCQLLTNSRCVTVILPRRTCQCQLRIWVTRKCKAINKEVVGLTASYACYSSLQSIACHRLAYYWPIRESVVTSQLTNVEVNPRVHLSHGGEAAYVTSHGEVETSGSSHESRWVYVSSSKKIVNNYVNIMVSDQHQRICNALTCTLVDNLTSCSDHIITYMLISKSRLPAQFPREK